MLSVMASGCTSIGAVQKPVVQADVARTFICPSVTEISNNEQKTGLARGQHRDMIILGCVKAINAHYGAFKQDMHREKTGFQLGTDIVALGATTGASFAATKLAKRLAALGAFAIGSGAAIDKSVFFQLTLPAIESAMDAQRDRIMTQVVANQKGDPTGVSYTLTMAGYELEAYQAAGNIYGAVSALTKVANADAQTAREALAAESARTIDVGIVSVLAPDILLRWDGVLKRIRQLATPKDDATIQWLATRLGVALPQAMPIDDIRGALVGSVMQQKNAASDTAALTLLTELEGRLPTSAGDGP